MNLLEATFEAVKPRAAELVEHFYTQLFQRYPSVGPLFAHANMQEQQGKLLSALALVVANLRNPDALVPALQGLGVRHIAYGAQPAHYDAVGSVLLDSLAYVAGDLWNEEAARAWSDAYTVAATVMVQAAEEAAAMTGASHSPHAALEGSPGASGSRNAMYGLRIRHRRLGSHAREPAEALRPGRRPPQSVSLWTWTSIWTRACVSASTPRSN